MVMQLCLIVLLVDAITAGLVGALGGAVLGAAGAWGAAVIAFRAARYQADRQADAEHQQWLRQIRRETYASFITLVSGLYDRLDTTDSIEEDKKKLNHILRVVRLEAPDHLGEAAQNLTFKLGELLFFRTHGASVDSLQKVIFLQQFNAFMKLCRETLANS